MQIIQEHNTDTSLKKVQRILRSEGGHWVR